MEFIFSSPSTYSKYRAMISMALIVSVYSCMLTYFFILKEFVVKMQIYNMVRFFLGAVIVLSALFWFPGDKASVRIKSYLFVEISIMIIFLYNYCKEMKIEFDCGVALKALRIGLPIMLSATLGIFVNFGDKFFIEKYCTLADMSIYYVSITCGSIITATFAAFQNVWLPLFLKEQDLIVNICRTKKMLIILSVAFFCYLSLFG